MEKGHLDPWGGKLFNKYETLYESFGIEPVSETVKELFKNTYLFEREIIIGYRDFNKILQQIEHNRDFVLVTGFASSGEFHFGHKLIIDVYNYFRKYTKRGYFVICDIDAYVSRPDGKIPTLETAKKYAINNIANALALGIKKEDISIQSKQDQGYFTFSHMISKKVTLNTMRAVLGHDDLGKFSACFLQIADILYPQLQDGVAPSLIPVGVDQEPIIRLTRDVAKKFSKQFNFEIPSSIYLAHLPGLTGYKDKMSKSIEGSAILLTEEEKNLQKIIDNAFTGGRETEEKQRELGGNPHVCPVHSLYKYNHPDSSFVKELNKKCREGKLLCGEDKNILKQYMKEIILKEHKEKYNKYLDVAKTMVE